MRLFSAGLHLRLLLTELGTLIEVLPYLYIRPAFVYCGRFEMSIAGISLSAVPEIDWSNHTHIIERGTKQRKRRPQSSPVRSTHDDTGSSDMGMGYLQDMQGLSPPVRPMVDQPRSLLDLARGDLPTDPFSTNTKDLMSKEGASRAYFSPQPPMAPLRLVKRPPPSGRVSPAPLLPSCEKPASPIVPLLLNTKISEYPKNSPLIRSSPKLVQELPMVGSGCKRTRSQSSNHDTMQTSTTSFGTSIESVTSAPPLLVACSHTNLANTPTSKSPAPVHQELNTQDINAVLKKMAIEQPSQVVNNENELENLVKCNDNSEEAGEWLGVVRALRDSHVRLVLRQLRHIDRLNRALDRATRPLLGQPATIASTSPQ